MAISERNRMDSRDVTERNQSRFLEVYGLKAARGLNDRTD